MTTLLISQLRHRRLTALKVPILAGRNQSSCGLRCWLKPRGHLARVACWSSGVPKMQVLNMKVSPALPWRLHRYSLRSRG
jgi:hypothetical protein